MVKMIQNDKILEALNTISPDLIPHVITGAELLEKAPVTGLSGLQGQTVKKVGRPRKQAENGSLSGLPVAPETVPADSVLIDGETRGLEGKRTKEKKGLVAACGDAFLSQYETPVFILFGSQWLEYDRLTGWRLCIDEGPARRQVERFLAERFSACFCEKLARDVFIYVRAKWTICKEFDYKSWWIHTDPKTGYLEPVEAPFWLACRNCVLNVKTRETFPYTPRLLAIGRIPCDYDPAADCVKFRHFIESVVKPDYVESLLMACGISLIYERQKSNVFFVLYGPSGTGKSTFFRILSEINKGTVCHVSLSDFGEKFGMVDLMTHRLNVVEDMESIYEGGKVSKREADLKKVACGEIIKDGEKYQKAQGRPARAVCFFGANRIPRFSDTSEAIADRMRLFPFLNKFRGTVKQNSSLADEIISEELPGILNLFLEYLGKFFSLLESPEPGKKTFPECELGTQEKVKAIKAARPWELWIDDHLETAGPASQIGTRELYDLYRDDSLKYGYSPKAENQFSELLLDYFARQGKVVEKKREKHGLMRQTFYRGLRLLKVGAVNIKCDAE